MDFQDRKVFGAFEKRAPDPNYQKPYEKNWTFLEDRESQEKVDLESCLVFLFLMHLHAKGGHPY